MLVTGGLLSLTRKGAVICGLHIYFTYYRLAFYIFAVVMGITTVIACTFKFQVNRVLAFLPRGLGKCAMITPMKLTYENIAFKHSVVGLYI